MGISASTKNRYFSNNVAANNQKPVRPPPPSIHCRACLLTKCQQISSFKWSWNSLIALLSTFKLFVQKWFVNQTRKVTRRYRRWIGSWNRVGIALIALLIHMYVWCEKRWRVWRSIKLKPYVYVCTYVCTCTFTCTCTCTFYTTQHKPTVHSKNLITSKILFPITDIFSTELRTGWPDEFVKKSPKMWPNMYFVIFYIHTWRFVVNFWPNNSDYFCLFILPKENNRPGGQNSPHLVTLVENQLSSMYRTLYVCTYLLSCSSSPTLSPMYIEHIIHPHCLPSKPTWTPFKS
jgi:hypothetical protein